MPGSALPSSTSVQPGRWLAAQGRLPLAFMALSLAWLAAGATLLAVQPGLLALPHMHPWVVALTHAWVLGFLVTAACGAVYQLAPVALGTTLWSERRGWWHFGLHAAGVPGMVYAFWHWDMVLLGHAGFLVLVGTALFAENTWRTVARSGKRNTTAWSIALAAGWLLLTALAGLTLAANRFWGFIPVDPLALLRAHAHLGLIGFFVTLLQGVSFTLIPMFTLAEVRSWRLVKAGLWCGQLGLVGLVAALAFHATWATFAFALLILVGFVCSGRALFSTLANRKKRLLGPGLAAFLRRSCRPGNCRSRRRPARLAGVPMGFGVGWLRRDALRDSGRGGRIAAGRDRHALQDHPVSDLDARLRSQGGSQSHPSRILSHSSRLGALCPDRAGGSLGAALGWFMALERVAFVRGVVAACRWGGAFSWGHGERSQAPLASVCGTSDVEIGGTGMNKTCQSENFKEHLPSEGEVWQALAGILDPESASTSSTSALFTASPVFAVRLQS